MTEQLPSGDWKLWLDHRDEKARARLIEGNMAVVEAALRRYRGKVRPADLDDLRGAGYAALVMAVDQFDPSRGMEFSQFVSLKVRYGMTDHIRACGFSKRGIRSEAKRLEAITEDLEQRLGRPPSDDELAAELGVDLDDLHALKSKLYAVDWRVVSIDSRLDGDGEDTGNWEDTLADRDSRTPEEETLLAERSAMLRDLVNRLPEKEARVVRGLYFEGRRAVDLAEEMGCHPSRVSQHEDSALTRLKELAHQQPLRLPCEEVAA
jgi:RNA polymerase sigma factor for flagellar operon FliA